MAYRARLIAAVQNHIPSEDTLRLLPPEHYLLAIRGALEAYSPQAASDGLEFVDVLCNKSNLPRPAVRWKQPARPPAGPPPQLPDRAAAASEEIDAAMGHVDAAYRAAVFRRNVMSFRLQRWYLGAGTDLRGNLADLLHRG